MAASDSRWRGGRRLRHGPASPLRRPRIRPGSPDAPINRRLVRAAALLVLPPLALLAFTIGQPGPYPLSPLPPAFDGASATALTAELALDYPDRSPGSVGAEGATRWLREKVGLYGLIPVEDAWDETIPGLGRVRLRNLVTTVRGATSEAILILAHRDNSGVGPGASDNASGTVALIELARGYGLLGEAPGRLKPQRTLIFLSTDGGAFGGFGAERFAATSPLRGSIRAAVSLDALGGGTVPRLELAGFAHRSPSPALVRTADVRISEQLGRSPARPSWLAQLVDLGMPFGYGEQAPFLGREISAVRITTTRNDGAGATADTTENLDGPQFVRLGTAAAAILASLDGGVELVGGTDGYVYLGTRIVRGSAVELLLLAGLIPFLVASVDLFARGLRKRLPLAGAFRALRTRFGFWLWIGAVVGGGAVAGVFPTGSAIAPPPDSPVVTDLPVAGLLVMALVAALGWWRARRVLVPRVPARDDEVLAGYTVALLALGAVAVATAIISPYTLVFIVPSLAAWLWLPQVERRFGWARDVLYGAGLVGPVLAVVAIEMQLGLGLDAPLYIVSLMTLGFVSWPTILVMLAWAAVAAQLGALSAGRYRPVERRAAVADAGVRQYGR